MSNLDAGHVCWDENDVIEGERESGCVVLY